jgi:hypothetical protein
MNNSQASRILIERRISDFATDWRILIKAANAWNGFYLILRAKP